MKYFINGSVSFLIILILLYGGSIHTTQVQATRVTQRTLMGARRASVELEHIDIGEDEAKETEEENEIQNRHLEGNDMDSNEILTYSYSQDDVDPTESPEVQPTVAVA